MTLALHGKSKQRQWLLIAAAFWAVVIGSFAAVAISQPASADDTVEWDGTKGTVVNEDGVRVPENIQCDEDFTPGLHWIFTLGGGSNTVTAATLTINGSDVYPGTKQGANFDFDTALYDLDTLTASVAYVGDLGGGESNLNISHGCLGEEPPQAVLNVDKTAEGSFITTCDWDVEKSADPTSVTIEHGQAATVDYEIVVSPVLPCVDSDWAVTGTVTVTNAGPDSVSLHSIVDSISGEICADKLPVDLAAEEFFVCEYDIPVENGDDGTNTATAYATITSGDDTGEEISNSDDADFTFGEPKTIVNECVTVTDSNDPEFEEVVCLDDEVLPASFKYQLEVGGDVAKCSRANVDNTAVVTGDEEVLDEDTASVEVVVYCDDTAWAANTLTCGSLRYTSRGNWATYNQFIPNDYGKEITILCAGQTNDAGRVKFKDNGNGTVTITVTLNADYFFASGDSLKVQGYASAPSGNPNPGLFANKTSCLGDTCSITVDYAPYYGVHVDVLSLPD